MSKVVQLSLLDLFEKYESEETASEPTPKKKRKSKYEWMKDERYEYTASVGGGNPDVTVNMMAFTKKVMAMKQWKNPERMKDVWVRTHKHHSGVPTARIDHNVVKITRSKTKPTSNGQANKLGFCRVTTGDYLADAMVIIVHELCHVDQDSCPVVNGVRRPHDLEFNLQQMKIAKSLWGYQTHPECAGWSIGKGYAPTRHLTKWLRKQIGFRNPQVMKFLTRLSEEVR